MSEESAYLQRIARQRWGGRIHDGLDDRGRRHISCDCSSSCLSRLAAGRGALSALSSPPLVKGRVAVALPALRRFLQPAARRRRGAGVSATLGPLARALNRRNLEIHGWLLLLPAAILLLAFTHLPAVSTLWHSFFSTARGGREAAFIGLDNYRDMLDDPVFWQVLRNNAVFALGTIPISILLALVMALWVNGRIAGRPFLRLAFFTPTVLPMIAVANIWLFFYTPGYGLIDQLGSLFGLGEHNWLGNKETVLPCLILVTVWKEAGFFMIFYLAALQQISPTLGEAAAVEGAGRWYFFRRITFPLLMPTTLFVLVNAVINSFRLVDHIVAMTKGGPDNASALLLYYIYDVGFRFWDTGYAAALTAVLLVLLAALALGQFLILDKRVHYQ
jgi:sn-glycerol 3-phosphate transport system permease protein